MTMSLVDHYWDPRYKLEKHPCAHCQGTGRVAVTRAAKIPYKGITQHDGRTRRKCAECLGDGYRTFRVKR